MNKKFQISDLCEQDKIAARKHIDWMRDNIGIISAAICLPVFGYVKINISGTIYKNYIS